MNSLPHKISKFIARLNRKVLVLFAIIKLIKNWPLVLIASLLAAPPPKYLILRGGKKFLLPRHLDKTELSFFSEIWYEHVYEPLFFDVLPEETVVDIGANVGYFSILAAFKAKRVFAFEPVPEIYARLIENIKLNHPHNVTATNAAVAYKSGKAAIHFASTNNGSHSLFEVAGAANSVEIETVNLEEFCASRGIEQIDFLKLDCEGAEYDILLNATPLLLSKIKKIAMEYHDNINEHKHGELTNFLKANGFVVAERHDLYIYAINLHGAVTRSSTLFLAH